MENFLASVAKDVTLKHADFLKLTLIVPGKRAGTFLQKELLSVTTKTTFAPQIVSIEDFVQDLSNVKLISNLQLLFEFYESYKEIHGEEIEDFHNFSKWAQILLQDFNEIDRYLIPQDQIFSYLFSIKDMDHWSNQDKKTEIQENYLSFWKKLHEYYINFTQRLLNKKNGYQGLIYREAIENIEFYLQGNDNHHAFVGFNALNTAEENLIQEFLHHGNASIYWDIDEVFLNDIHHDAGLFMRRYAKGWKYFKNHVFNKVSTHYSSEKKIKIIGIPKNVGQAKYVGSILNDIEKADLESTAVILGNEGLLAPVLNSIPNTINRVNITCGFKLSDTPLASFFMAFFDLIENQNAGSWYYKKVETFFSHSISSILFHLENIDYSKKVIAYIQKENIIRVSLTTITDIVPASFSEIINLVFINKQKSTIDNIISGIISVILYIKEKVNDNLILEYLFRFYEIFNQLQLLNTTYKSIADIQSLKGIYNELLSKETVDFKGEPLEGLQIMGVLESRNLDFETVIITSVNEGVLPSGKSNNSFLPFDIKINYGLPTHKEKDAVYTYHFYRLLQRAKNIYLLYNTEPDVLEGGEKSRFIRQIIYQNLPGHDIEEIIAGPEVHFETNQLKEIQKTPLLIQKLKEIAEKGFSPTSLSNYVRNPLDFYYQSVLGIKNVEEVEETVAANTLGTVIHDTLEEFYLPLTGKILEVQHILSMKPRVTETVTSHFRNVYKKGDISKGKNLIILHVAIRYIENFLNFDLQRIREGKSIKIVEVESNLKVEIDIPELDYPVYIKGKVDRVEEIDGVINIIDYKTGKVSNSDLTIVEWEDLTADYKYSKAFQVLCYAYMINANRAYNNPVEAGIISFKNLQEGVMKFCTKESSRARNKETFITPDTYLSYLTELKKLIIEICDIGIPFKEKEIKTTGY